MFKNLKNKISYFRQNKKFESFYGEFINKGDLCFDLGANIGNRTEVFSNLGARVVSVEPVKETFRILNEKFAMKNNVTPLQFGVGSEAGQKEIYISDIKEVCTLSELFIEKYKEQEKFNIAWNTTELIEICTLDQLIVEHGLPNFCKIDVEGYELEVLKGLSQPLPMMSIEYNAKLKDLALSCINHLSKFKGLLYNFSPYETMVFSLDSWKSEKEFVQFIKLLPNEIQTGDIYVRWKKI